MISYQNDNWAIDPRIETIRHAPMKGAASATNEASPTPTTIRQNSSDQKPACHQRYANPLRLMARDAGQARNSSEKARSRTGTQKSRQGCWVKLPMLSPHPAAANVHKAKPHAMSLKPPKCLLACANTGENSSSPICSQTQEAM